MPVITKSFDPFLAYGPVKENEVLKSKLTTVSAKIDLLIEKYGEGLENAKFYNHSLAKDYKQFLKDLCTIKKLMEE